MKFNTRPFLSVFFLFAFFCCNDPNAVQQDAIIKQNEKIHSYISEMYEEPFLIFKDGILQSSIRNFENIPELFRLVNLLPVKL